MLKDKITVMIIPRQGGNMSSHSIPVKLLWAVALFGICFLVINVFLLADYFSQRVDRARLNKLLGENQMLSEQYAAVEESINELRGNYAELVNKEEAIRTIFGLPAIDEEARMLGVGGPEDPALNNFTEATAEALKVSADVDELLRLAKFERERYREVYEILDNKRDLLNHTPSIMPTRGHFSSGYGTRNDPFTGLKEFHPGLDISNGNGTPIYATANGKISAVRINGGLGKMISIDHGYGFKTRYGHMSDYKVKVGQRVKRGEIIGLMGSTGYTTGPHLHYEVIKNGKHINPYKFIINK
ncbi:MAG: M23 family metallopeptidase [Candidatus Zixiibacteriota bacterium]